MKVSSIAVLAALAVPVAGEIYLKEQFNDKVRRTDSKTECHGLVPFLIWCCNANGKVFALLFFCSVLSLTLLDFCMESMATGLEQAMVELHKVEAQG